MGLKLNNDLTFSCQIKCVSKNRKQGSYLGAGSVNYNITLQGKFDGCSCNRPEPGSHSGIPDHEFQCQLSYRSSTSVMQNVLCTSLSGPSLEHACLLLQLEQLSWCVLHACFPGIGTSYRACLRASSEYKTVWWHPQTVLHLPPWPNISFSCYPDLSASRLILEQIRL